MLPRRTNWKAGGSQSWHFPKQPSYGGLCVCAPLPLLVHSSVTHCHCHPPVTSESSSSDLQQGLKVSGNLQAIHARLSLIRHLASWIVQLPSSLFSSVQIITVGLPNTYAVGQSNKPFWNTIQSTDPVFLENPN